MDKGARTLATASVLLLLAVTLAPPLQRYFTQRAQIGALQGQLHDSQQALTQATEELSQWNDTGYVESQARIRLHFIFPGERQYAVIGLPASVVNSTDAAQINTIGQGAPWYIKVASSITSTNAG
jgi:cell division protein FtsB